MKKYTPEERVQRFWAKVDQSGGPDACWLWTGPRLKAGYGSYRTGSGKRELAHRYAYALAHGPVPDGLFICHHCDTPACVQPSHLFAGSHGANMRDMQQKGRSTHGERGTAVKLTEQQVREIYDIYAAGTVLMKELARMYHVSRSDIGMITSGRTWKHLGLSPIPRQRYTISQPGEACGHARLTEASVRSIRAAYAEGVPVKKLAADYQVVHATVSLIVHRKTWRHI